MVPSLYLMRAGEMANALANMGANVIFSPGLVGTNSRILDLEIIVQLPREWKPLRIFIGEADRHQGRPPYEWIPLQARKQGPAGATMLRSIMGFANTRQIHTLRFDTLSEDLPVIIEVVDSTEKLDQFLSRIEPHIKAGPATLEKAKIKFYRFEP